MSRFILIVNFLITALSSTSVEGMSHSVADFTVDTKIDPSVKASFLIPNVKYIKEGNELFGVFCVEAVPKSVFQMWRSVQLVLLDIPLNYEIFPGNNDTEVQHNYKSRSFFNPSFRLFDSGTVVEFPAFSPYCIGIEAEEKYSFFLKVRVINYWRVLQTLLGIFLYLSAPNLSRNSFFHYASGISLGVIASLLIILYFIGRFVPKSIGTYAVLGFGYSIVLYFLKILWHHTQDIVSQYLDVVIGYCAISALLSFIVCYRIGPVKSERTLNLIQWSMQSISLLLIFFSSEYREVSTALIMILLGLRMIPLRWIKKFKSLWYRCFPPRVKLITELEFIEQGHVETKKALDDLRRYCSSPDCQVWRVVRSLKDPIRFANFIENGSHYTDQELLAYNSEEEFPEADETEENTNF